MPVPASTMRWRLSAKAFSTAWAISYWPGRCSKAREDLERIPPGEKKARSVGKRAEGFGVSRRAGVIEMGIDGDTRWLTP